MIKFFQFVILMTVISVGINAQTRRDPRGMALAGAYGLMSRGYFCIDYNPANLAIHDRYKSYRSLGGLNFGFSNNFLSLSEYQKYNGKNFEADNGKLKNEFLTNLPKNGWRIFSDFHFSLPLINYSSVNKAITSDIIVIGDLGLPRGLIYFLFDGNPLDRELDLDFSEETLAIAQWAYSFAIPVKNFNVGLSLKYLMGGAFFGLDPDSSYGSITTSFESGINGNGHYLFEQKIGGHGFGIDIGVNTEKINGFRFGVSITNLFANINFGKETVITRMIDAEKILPWDGKFYQVDFEIDSASFEKFFAGAGYDEIFKSENTTIENHNNMSIRYPSLVRFSVSKDIREESVLAIDFVAGFEDRLFSFGSWKFCAGVETTHFPHTPLRIGVAFGGKDHRSLNFGSGYHRGFFHFDWALGFTHSIFIKSSKGLEFSVNLFTTRLWKIK